MASLNSQTPPQCYWDLITVSRSPARGGHVKMHAAWTIGWEASISKVRCQLSRQAQSRRLWQINVAEG